CRALRGVRGADGLPGGAHRHDAVEACARRGARARARGRLVPRGQRGARGPRRCDRAARRRHRRDRRRRVRAPRSRARGSPRRAAGERRLARRALVPRVLERAHRMRRRSARDARQAAAVGLRSVRRGAPDDGALARLGRARAAARAPARLPSAAGVDVNVEPQVIGSSLRAIAEEMGAVLIRSAFSANIKERRDCSTALFDERGRMTVQAEHIPVHLGAMPDAVAAVMSLTGDLWILNDPYTGGTHLPDVTLVSRTALGYAVSRAHHADVGGIEPASLPAFSRTLAEEGVIVEPQLLTDAALEAFVAQTRRPEERRGDLRAQLAAHRLAERRLDELCERRGRDEVIAAMDELYAHSERVVRS